MAKSLPDATLDGLLDVIAGGNALNVCSAEPANQAGIAAVSLASVTLDSGDFTKANGDTSGRKVTVAAQNGLTVAASGTATHVVVSDGSALKAVTTCASQVLTSGNPLNVSAFKCEVADPT